MSVNSQNLMAHLEKTWNLPIGGRYWGKLSHRTDIKGDILYYVEKISAFGRNISLTIPPEIRITKQNRGFIESVLFDRKVTTEFLSQHDGETLEFSFRVIPRDQNTEFSLFAQDVRFLTQEEINKANQAIIGLQELDKQEKQAQEKIETLLQNFSRMENKLSTLKESNELLEAENSILDENHRKLEESISAVRRRAKWFSDVGLLPDDLTVSSTKRVNKNFIKRVDVAPEDIDWELALDRVGSYISGQGGIYPIDFVQNFMALMCTHDIVVLAGRSGTGKTSFCRLFSMAVGADITVVPVKPNWVGSDDLLGYWNPVNRTYIRTAFVDALAKARRNPEKLHLIVLDEMNIARPEYYLADLLSVLEDRSKRDLSIETTVEKRKDFRNPERIAALNKLLSALQRKSNGVLPTLGEMRERFGSQLADALDCKVAELDTTLINMSLEAADTSEHLDDDIVIPDNVRIIGTINIDETTNFFSPKVLDRVFLVRLDDPLSVPDSKRCSGTGEPYVMSARCFGERAPYPKYEMSAPIVTQLNDLSELIRNLGFDISLRVLRQAMNYANKLSAFTMDENEEPAFVNIIRSKILPRMVFDADETPSGGKYRSKSSVLEKFTEAIAANTSNQTLINECQALCRQAESGDHQVNFWAL